jgi:hypothetical protein
MANIPIKDSEWNSLSSDTQSAIQSIISDHFPGISCVPDSSGLSCAASPSKEDITSYFGFPMSSAADSSSAVEMAAGAVVAASAQSVASCKEDCNSMRDGAMVACAALAETGIGAAICALGVEAAAVVCRHQCEDN